MSASIGVSAVRSRLQTAGRGLFASAAAGYDLQYPTLVCESLHEATPPTGQAVAVVYWPHSAELSTVPQMPSQPEPQQKAFTTNLSKYTY